MDTNLTLQYNQSILGSFSFGKRLLVWDSYACHIELSVSADLKLKHFEEAIIPGGCTKYVQMPDISWNKPFKASVSENYAEWLSTIGIHQVTDAGNLKSPPRQAIVEWIVNAWADLDTEIVRKSFKVCGLNLVVDGSEDSLIHCLKEGQPCHAGLEVFNSQLSILSEPDVNPF